MQKIIVILILGAVVAWCILTMKSKNTKENMSGYGSISGLAFNNNAKHCFKNVYDPPWFAGYCETIGKVVV